MEEGGIIKLKIKIKNREASTFFSKHAPFTPPTAGATKGRIQGVLREERAKGQRQEEEAPHKVGILKGLYCLPAAIGVLATCWALQGSPTNPEALGNLAAVQLSPPRGPGPPGADRVAEGLRVRGGGLSSIPCGGDGREGPS